MAADNRTEDPSAQRRQKAEARGSIVRSREVTTAATLFAVIITLAWVAGGWVAPWRKYFEDVLQTGGSQAMLNPALLFHTGILISLAVGPIIWLAFFMAIGSQFAQGGFIFSTEPLAINFDRLNPASNLGKLFSLRGMVPLLRSLLPAGYILNLAVNMMRRDWPSMVYASHLSVAALLQRLMGEAYEIAWKACLVMVVWSAVDYIIQKKGFETSLKMTKQEVQEEMKDSLGNPAIKGQIRNLQRQMRRKMMLQHVQRATVVITNPTHYAVALQYDEDMAAPTVIAKGRNLIAQQIKKIALWENIPIVENKPLAQSLYKTVEVGQSIPPQLYTAVAEILAFIYRAQAMAAAAASRRTNTNTSQNGGMR